VKEGRVMKDISRTERLLNLISTIQNYPGIQAKELAEFFGCTTRTIQRDICFLRKNGFLIDSSTGAAGGFRSRGSYSLKPLVFSGEEALAIFVTSKILLEQKGFPFRDDLESALAKISQVIRKEDIKLFKSLEARTSIMSKRLKDYYSWGDVFTEINRAILDHVIIEITYNSYNSRKVTVRKVDPYHIMFREGCWYLIAYCHWREEIRIFRIDRIINIKRTHEQFSYPAGFSLQEFFKMSWQIGKGEEVTVKIRFEPPVAHLIREKVWHPMQEIEESEGGSLIYTVRVEGTYEIKQWILGWGTAAECLEPEELRDEIRRELVDAAGKY
jgi:predicted DNA-binding transcriptional regulator YafY